MSLQFVWDEGKAAANILKHDITFEDASTVFADPLAVIFNDEAHSLDETRELILGHSTTKQLILVSFTERDDVTTLHRLKPSSFYGFAPMLYRPRATKVCTMSDAHNVLRQTRLRSANPLHHLLSKCGYNPQKKAVATGGYSPAPSLQL